MRLELLPVLFGVLVALLGGALVADAWLPDEILVPRERRRRPRAERDRLGEGAVGAGVLCMAAALIGRDQWAYGTLAVILGTVLLVIGVVRNRRYLRERVTFRGAARRAHPEAGELPPTPTPPPRPEKSVSGSRRRIR